jgi:hypothetical protein
MRKALIAAVAMLAIAALPPFASATHSGGTGPKQDLTVGSGTNENPGFSLTAHVNAQSEDGVNPRGRLFVEINVPGLPFVHGSHGVVTCHRVVGNRAIVGGSLRDPFVGPVPGFVPPGVFPGVFIVIEDQGEPGNQDGMSFFLSPTVPAACPPPIPVPDTIERGNFVVHDG